MNIPLLLYGFAIWFGATVALRFSGQHILHPGSLARTLLLFIVSLALTALLARRLCSRFKLPREAWPEGAVSLLLPTLLLDPFSSAFFSTVFPNMPAEAAGAFGGWMLICCAGALLGVTFRRRSQA